MKCAITQPTYLPWIGLFALIDQVDTFIFYDDVQVVKQSWATRNKIKTKESFIWLSVPIQHDASHKDLKFYSTHTDEKKNWKVKHYKSIQNAYAKAPFFTEVNAFFEPLLLNGFDTLKDVNCSIITGIAKRLGITTNIIYSSDLRTKEGVKDIRLVDICREIGATGYLSPIGSHDYIESNNKSGAFLNTEIALTYSHYEHPTYPQVNGDFMPYMCIVDLLYNVGLDNSMEVIRSGIRKAYTSDEVRAMYNHQ